MTSAEPERAEPGGGTIDEPMNDELDLAWQAALFLTGGDEVRSEALMLRAVSTAPSPPQGSVASMELCVLSTFCADVDEGDPLTDADSASRHGGSSVDALLAAAASVPPWPRAAIWLALVRRWSHIEAAAALGVSRGRLVELLQPVEVFLSAAVDGPSDAASPRGRRRREERPE